MLALELNSPKRFPADAVINIRDCGAKGDGTSDDTAAIKRAIEENIGQKRLLFFPKGTYLVSDTLPWKDAQGRWKAWLSLQGESALTTVIRLKDSKGIDAIKPKLDELKPGEEVFVVGKRLTEPPPKDQAAPVVEYGKKIGLKVQGQPQ